MNQKEHEPKRARTKKGTIQKGHKPKRTPTKKNMNQKEQKSTNQKQHKPNLISSMGEDFF
jgi:hypothetical protein